MTELVSAGGLWQRAVVGQKLWGVRGADRYPANVYDMVLI